MLLPSSSSGRAALTCRGWAAPRTNGDAPATNDSPRQFGFSGIGRCVLKQFRSMARWEFNGSTHHPAEVILHRAKTRTGSGSVRGRNENLAREEKASLSFRVRSLKWTLTKCTGYHMCRTARVSGVNQCPTKNGLGWFDDALRRVPRLDNEGIFVALSPRMPLGWERSESTLPVIEG